MGRAILIVSFIVVCSFVFVLLQLRNRAPAASFPPAGPAPVLETREDGSIYSVGLRLDRLEDRLVESEKRAAEMDTKLQATTAERDTLQQQVQTLDARVEQLQQELRQVNPPSVPPPGNAPTEPSVPGTAPVTPLSPGTGAGSVPGPG